MERIAAEGFKDTNYTSLQNEIFFIWWEMAFYVFAPADFENQG